MEKQLSNSFSTGSGGGHFEAHVQSSFVALMLTGGYAPCLPAWPIKKVKFQCKLDGYDTDDLVVFVECEQTGEVSKLLGQVKHSIAFTNSDNALGEVIYAAWSDFNKPTHFNKTKDVIALITGPVSATDQRNVQWILYQAKYTNDVYEFFRRVKETKFSPSQAEKKLEVLRFHLKKANSGVDVSDETLYEFIRHFYWLGYDVGGETGIVLPLLHSHISQFNLDSKAAWGQIVDYVQTYNQNAGTITRNNLPRELVDKFVRRSTVEEMPETLHLSNEKLEFEWNNYPLKYELSLVTLLGGWDEKNEHDLAILKSLLRMEYEDWLPKARDIIHQANSPINLSNGIWIVTQKEELLDFLMSQLLDTDIDRFKDIAIHVLSESDPAFDLDKEERYAAAIHGKKMKHSGTVRQGVAEGVALLSAHKDKFANCTLTKPEFTAILVVRELLSKVAWRRWATLNNLLPDLAEAAPNEFLDQIDNLLLNSPNLFEEIFKQEGSGISGNNYLTGLLWALERLAWEEKYLVRVSCILAEIATYDPGGSWANRPANSLATILLPWLPQTLASIEKRTVAVKTILVDVPEIGWDLLVKLLPGQRQTSSGSNKPKWRKVIPDSWDKGVTRQEYWEQVTFYSDLAVKTAGFNVERVIALISHLDHLTSSAFNTFIEKLSSKEMQELPDKSKQQIWDKLSRFVNKHRRFSDAKWALSEELLIRIERAAQNFSPKDSFSLYQHLFSEKDFDLYEENGNWQEQRERLAEKRQNAVSKLLSDHGLDRVIDFADNVPSSRDVGYALGAIGNDKIDASLLPDFLNSNERKRTEFISAYIWRRHHILGWNWADNYRKDSWTMKQTAKFLAYLPFEENAWHRAESWLNNSENAYWEITPANSYQTDDDLDYAIEKLLIYGRPRAALDCLGRLRFDKKPVNSSLCVRALMASLSSKEPSQTLEKYNIVELIKLLQEDSSLDETSLFRVEWAYLPLLDGYYDAEPTLLENKLATDPDFFCELIRLVYRSKNEEAKSKSLSEEKKLIAKNAWNLLHHWHTPPGSQLNGEFSPERLDSWLNRVKEESRKSGHFEVAMINIGNVLIHAPQDDAGLWIHKAVAKVLNDKDSEDARSGFSTATFNARGAHTIDPTGRPEKDLAEQYRVKAESVENEGFRRFAATLRYIAERYDEEARRIQDEYGDDDS